MQSHFRRGWWKPWNWSTRTWMLAIFVSLLISPLITRWCCLWQVPDVALPFDVEDVIRPGLAADQDAFVRYASAMKIASRQKRDVWFEDAMNIWRHQHVLDWDDRFDQFLIDNAPALEEFCEASEMELAGGPSLRTADDTTDLSYLYGLRYLTGLAAAEAIRHERSGDLKSAWQMNQAILNCARHAEKPGGDVCSAVSTLIRSNACFGIKRWAENPKLTVDQLQAARSEVSLAFLQRTSLVDITKAEYLDLRNTLRRHDAPNYLFPEWNTGGSIEPPLLVAKRFLLWSVGQPELTLRLARQLLVNRADQIDKPLRLRRKAIRSKDGMVFELDFSVRRKWGQLEPAALARALDRMTSKRLLKNASIFNGNQMSIYWKRDDVRQVALDVVLASHQYQRSHGEFPASIEQLVPKFLDSVPIDPMDATGASLRYRRERDGHAVVWSVGPDEIDDGGHVEPTDFNDKDMGYRIRLKPRPQNENP